MAVRVEKGRDTTIEKDERQKQTKKRRRQSEKALAPPTWYIMHIFTVWAAAITATLVELTRPWQVFAAVQVRLASHTIGVPTTYQ